MAPNVRAVLYISPVMVHENLKILIFETGSLWLFLNFAVKLYLAKTGPETGQEIANQRKD